MKFLAGLLGPAIDDDEDDDRDTAPQGLLSAPVVQQAVARGLLGYDGAAQLAPAVDAGPDDPRNAYAAFPAPVFDPLATLQGILGPSYFIDTNADMQESRRDLLAAGSGGASAAPASSQGDDAKAVQAPPAPPPTFADLERQYKRDNVSPAVPQFDRDARPEEVSNPSLEVLNRIVRDAGLDIGQLRVTSTKRTPAGQAKIMYDQLTAGDTSTYGKYGQQLRDIWQAGRDAGDPADVVIKKMTERAQQLLDQNKLVSNHFRDPADMNVFDIAPRSIPEGKTQAFLAALKAAKARGDLHDFHSRYTTPYDPAFHLEIDQPALRANMNTARQNELFRQWENQHPYATER